MPKSSQPRLADVLSRITILPVTLSPNGLTRSIRPFPNPFDLTRSSASSDAYTATVGENDRTIKLRTSSSASVVCTSVDANEDRPKRESEIERDPLGESDLTRLLTRVLAKVDKGGLEGRIGRLVVDVSGESFLAGDLFFETYKGGTDANGDGCWSGS